MLGRWIWSLLLNVTCLHSFILKLNGFTSICFHLNFTIIILNYSIKLEITYKYFHMLPKKIRKNEIYYCCGSILDSAAKRAVSASVMNQTHSVSGIDKTVKARLHPMVIQYPNNYKKGIKNCIHFLF